MPAFQAECVLLPCTGAACVEACSAGSKHDASARLHGLFALLAAILDRRVDVEWAVADKYAGHAWCDSTEREMNARLMGTRNKLGC